MRKTITTTIGVFFLLFFLLTAQYSTAQISITGGPSYITYLDNDGINNLGYNAQINYRLPGKNYAFLLRAAYYLHEIEPQGRFPLQGEFKNLETVAGVTFYVNETDLFSWLCSAILVEGNLGLNNYTVITSRVVLEGLLPAETEKRSLVHIGTRVGWRLGWQHFGLKLFAGSYLPFDPDGGSILVVEGGAGVYASF